MKKKLNSLFVLLILTVASPVLATSPEALEPNTTNTESARSASLFERLDQINKMNKSSLTLTEKRELRTEVKSIRNELKDSNVSISIGAVIIILLLLIILL
jgi:biopolymer transport protein ExbD